MSALTDRHRQLLVDWGVDNLRPLSGDHVWSGMRGDEQVVVKVGSPEARAREMAALLAYRDGHMRMLCGDARSGILVTQRQLPGDDVMPVVAVDDDEATKIVAEVLVRLHSSQQPTSDLPALAEIGVAFDRPRDPRLPDDLRSAARSAFDDLLVDSGVPHVLHGDLHHMNVLRGPDGWRAIDPHGWVGDAAFDAAALFASPRGLVDGGDARGMDGRALAVRTRRRAAIVAEVTGLDPDRLRAWAFVGCVIAELWMIEDHGMVHGAPLALARALSDEGV